MKKVIIIRTPFVFPVKHLSSITSIPDVGTAYINGTLKAHGYDSKIIDAAGEGIGKRYKIKGTRLAIGGINADEIIAKIPKDVDYVGLQSMHSNRWIYDGYIVEKIIEKFPHVKIFLGGEHVTATAEKILEQIPRIDACVVGEGEETVIELLKAFDNDEGYDHIAGLAYRKKGLVVINPRRQRKKNVDDIPHPSWDGVPIQNYLDNHCGINSLARKAIPMMATRGCPYSCTFCTVPNMWDSKWFARDPESVIFEIKHYVEEFGVNHIDFVDLTLVIDKRWMHKFCDLLLKEDMDLTWAIPIGTRTESLDKELLTKMKASGLARVLYSAESGDPETLERIKKCLTVQHFENIVYETAKLGVITKVALIFGFPGQTMKEVFGTFKLLNKLVFLGCHDVVCLSFIPYPKTELFDEIGLDYDYTSEKNNIRLNNDIPNMKSWSDHFSSNTLRVIILGFTLYFYAFQYLTHPMRFFRGFKRVVFDKLPLTNFESIIYLLISKGKVEETVEEVSISKSHLRQPVSNDENKETMPLASQE